MDKRTQALISPIAAFIGARLQHPFPTINGQGNPWVSTIKVDQYKEKFWEVRVYCDLAHSQLVDEYWLWLKERQSKSPSDQRYDRLSSVELNMLNGHATPPREFFKLCARRDALYYRKVYRDMGALLQPELASSIYSSADHHELLHETLLDAFQVVDEQLAGERHEDYEAYYLRKYHAESVAELRALFQRIYEPLTRDIIDLRC